MTELTEEEINKLLAEVREEYEEEDRAAAAAAEEAREAAARCVFSVRLTPELYAAVRDEAERVHLTPSAMIRQWISERIDAGAGDLNDAIASLRHDVDRVEKVVQARDRGSSSAGGARDVRKGAA